MSTRNSTLMGKRPSLDERDDFGRHLVELRLNAGLTQAQVAEAVGTTQAQYSRWEKTGQLPGKDAIPAIAKLFGVTLEELLQEKVLNGPHRGPKGELERIFEEARSLPKTKKKQIAEVLKALIEKARNSSGN